MSETTQTENAGAAAGGSAPPHPETIRPDHIPEKFWDNTQGAPRVDDLARSYAELEKKLGTSRADIIAEYERTRLASRPETADGYKVALDGMLPEDVVVLNAVPGDDFKPEDGKAYFILDEADPLLKSARSIAHEVGMKPEQFNALVAAYVQNTATRVPTAEERLAGVKAELAKLGPDGEARAIAIGKQLESTLGKDVGSALIAGITSASMLEAVEGLMKRVNNVGFSPDQTGSAAPALTEGHLREMVARANDLPHGDPARARLNAEITEGYKRLYGG